MKLKYAWLALLLGLPAFAQQIDVGSQLKGTFNVPSGFNFQQLSTVNQGTFCYGLALGQSCDMDFGSNRLKIGFDGATSNGIIETSNSHGLQIVSGNSTFPSPEQFLFDTFGYFCVGGTSQNNCTLNPFNVSPLGAVNALSVTAGNLTATSEATAPLLVASTSTTSPTVTTHQIIGTGTPSAAAQPGMGTGGSLSCCTVTGYDNVHVIGFTTGVTTGATSEQLLTVTFGQSLTTPFIGCGWSPRNQATINAPIDTGTPGTTGYNFMVGTTALASNTSYLVLASCQ